MIFHKKKSFFGSAKGFSIAEVSLAAFVLTTGLVAVLALITNSLKNSLETNNTIIAVGLAQEGIELVRNMRDNDFVQDPANDGFVHFPSESKYCRISYRDNLLDCNPSNYSLQFNNGFYEHGGSGGRFSRRIYVDYKAADKKALVRSFVYWGSFAPPNDGSAAGCTVSNKCVFTEITLKNWK